jgi:hypothetical protein
MVTNNIIEKNMSNSKTNTKKNVFGRPVFPKFLDYETFLVIKNTDSDTGHITIHN